MSGGNEGNAGGWNASSSVQPTLPITGHLNPLLYQNTTRRGQTLPSIIAPWHTPPDFVWTEFWHDSFVGSFMPRLLQYNSRPGFESASVYYLATIDEGLNELLRYLNWCEHYVPAYKASANYDLPVFQAVLQAYERMKASNRLKETEVRPKRQLLEPPEVTARKVAKAKETSVAEVNQHECCNRRVFNVETNKRERCGRTPVVVKCKKQWLCGMHRDERNNKARQSNYNRRLKKQNAVGDSQSMKSLPATPPDSMSLLCAITDDGFFLDVWPSTHIMQDKKHEENHVIHHGSMRRLHVPQTYMILFHKFLLHGGSANTTNECGKTGQQRLFSYVTTNFDKDVEYIQKTSDIPEPRFSYHYKMCVAYEKATWNCGESDCKTNHYKMNLFKPTDPNILKEWDKTIPGTVVDGDMDKLGYMIVRTSITKGECPYLLHMERTLKMNDWTNISSTGGQPLLKKASRQQCEVTIVKRTVRESEVDTVKKLTLQLYDMAFSKLEKDLLLVNRNFKREGFWTQQLVHRKILRNIGQIVRQRPHTDYNNDSSTKRSKDEDTSKQQSQGGKSKKK